MADNKDISVDGVIIKTGKKHLMPMRTLKGGKKRIRYDELKIVKRREGRPSKWKPEFCSTIYYARALGRTDLEVCEQLGISTDSLYLWLKTKPEFKKSYDDGKHALHDVASKALFHKLSPRKLKRTEVKDFVDKQGNITKLYSTIEQDADIDVLALNNFLNRRVKSFKLDMLEDPNADKVDQLLGALAQLAPDKMRRALDERAVKLAQESMTVQTINIGSDPTR